MRASVVTVAVALCAAAALAGCGRKEEAKAPAEPAATSEPSAATPLMAKRRPGLWRQAVSMTGSEAVQTTSLCLDEAADAKLAWWGGQSRDICSKNVISHLPDGGWSFTSVCDMGSGGVVTTTGVAQGNFNAHYEVKAESSTEGAALDQMNGKRAMTVVADWVSACPDGMKGGEVELPGGLRMNLIDAMASQPAPKP